MGCIGRSIIQTKEYIDPKATEPMLNYNLAFPITVFDAVRLSMEDEQSLTLMEALKQIQVALRNKQPLLPSKPANYLVTYGGTAGAVGNIMMTREIPWDPQKQSHDRIPTEKAVGDLMFKLGLVDENGNTINDPESDHVRWSDVIGRPLTYECLGYHDDGYVTQKAITEIIDGMYKTIDANNDFSTSSFNKISDDLSRHLNDYNNPHRVTAELVGAPSTEEFQSHLDNNENPHNVTKEQVGLGNVDDTSDEDKPISNATKEALEILKEEINILSGNVGDLDFIINAEYDKESGRVILTLKSGNTIVLYIPTDGLVDEVRYDKEIKSLIIHELYGQIKTVDLSNLITKIKGYNGNAITVIIDEDEESNTKTIKAEIKAKSITAGMLADGIINSDTIIDGSITEDKIADGAITENKIAEKNIKNRHLDDRSVDGRTLFSSNVANRILGVLEAGTNPIWTQIISEMIGNEEVHTNNLRNLAVTTDKVDNLAITEDKLAESSVTNNKIMNQSITSDKLAIDIIIPGNPRIELHPNSDSDDNSIPDTQWVRETIAAYVNTTDNYGDRTIIGSKLFTSTEDNRILAVISAGSDPIWTTINNRMMEKDSISTDNIQDLAVISDKLANGSVIRRTIADQAIFNEHFYDNVVDSRVLWHGPGIDYVIASVLSDGTPGYSKVTRGMLDKDSVTSDAILDGSVTPGKIKSTTNSNTVLAVLVPDGFPEWTKVTGNMIAPRSIGGTELQSSYRDNMVMAVRYSEEDAAWSKIYGEMITDSAIKHNHMAPESVGSDQLIEKSVEGKHLADDTIPGRAIEPHSITGEHIMRCEDEYKVLAVLDPYTDAVWSSIKTKMIEDEAVTKEKIWYSEHDYRVLGATQAGMPSEYLKITNDFIVDDTIQPEKLVKDFTLFGNPELTTHPPLDANNFQLTSTAWVRRYVSLALAGGSEAEGIDGSIIINQSISPSSIASSDNAPRVLGINNPGDDVDFILIQTGHIASNAITRDKIVNNAIDESKIADKSITTHKIADHSVTGYQIAYNAILPGTPTIETRPNSDANNKEIPDTYWVRQLVDSSTFTLDDRAVDGSKLFTSDFNDRVLIVHTAGDNPEWGKINSDMLENSLELRGSPVLKNRPPEDASDENGNGNLIPDCQWVLDRIAEYVSDILKKKKWATGVTDNVVNSIIANAFNNTLILDDVEKDVPELDTSDYFDVEDVYTVTQKVVTNIHNNAFNNTLVNGESKLPISDTDDNDFALVDEAYRVSDKVVENIHNQSYNNTLPDDEDLNKPVEDTSDEDYTEILSHTGVSNIVVTNTHNEGFNNTLVGNETQLPITPTGNDDYHDTENVVSITDKVVNNLHAESYNATIPETGGEPIDTSPTDDSDYTSTNKSNSVSDKVVGNVIAGAYNNTMPSRKLPIHDVDATDYTQIYKNEKINTLDLDSNISTIKKSPSIYTTKETKNIILSSDRPTSSSKEFSNGDVWFQYL